MFFSNHYPVRTLLIGLVMGCFIPGLLGTSIFLVS